MTEILNLLQHLPETLQVWASSYGAGLYVILACIIFAETGLVVTPLLPGDSLLFAVGALLAIGLPNLDLSVMIVVLIAAALAGDTVNFHVGRWMAPRLFRNQQSRWLNPKHLERTREFYERHGGKTVILARFIPILRTYVPFVTGMSGMPYSRFMMFSVTGGTLWIASVTSLGYFFGNLPAVKTNFHLVILAILVVSLAPVAIEFLRSRRRAT
jgi:membrane-associated protein